MPFTDLHLHPNLKTQFSDASDRVKPCDTIDANILPAIHRMRSDFGSVLQSQCNLTQLDDNDVKLICAALYAPEPALFDGRTNPLVGLSRNARMSRVLTTSQLNKFLDRAVYSPFDTLQKAVTELLSSCGPTAIQLRPLRRKSDFNEANGEIFVVFSVEGCHSLVDRIGNFDDPATLPGIIIGNLDRLRAQVPVIAVNLTHMEQFSLCNHAFGMQFLQNSVFFPTRIGMSPEAWTVVDACMNRHILIDIKHMSVMARQQYYARLSSAGFPAPIICTHAGFSGLPAGKLRDFVIGRTKRGDIHRLDVAKPKKYLKETTFNATSISLFDEDIATILRSGGIVGLSMDSRILGFNPKHPTDADINAFVTDEDVLSHAEIGILHNLQTLGRGVDRFTAMQNTDVSDSSQVLGSDDMQFLHFKHIVNHLIHLMKIARDNGISPLQSLKHICLGSDFDGMISPVAFAPTIGSYGQLKRMFQDFFLPMIDEANDLDSTLRLVVPADQLDTITEDIFYRNGRDFILNRVELI